MGNTITTANFYLRNTYQFLKYMKETTPRLCCLYRFQLRAAVRALTAALGNITKRVVLHQLKVKAKKMSRVISRETLKKCREMANAKTTQLLGECTSCIV